MQTKNPLLTSVINAISGKPSIDDDLALATPGFIWHAHFRVSPGQGETSGPARARAGFFAYAKIAGGRRPGRHYVGPIPVQRAVT